MGRASPHLGKMMRIRIDAFPYSFDEQKLVIRFEVYTEGKKLVTEKIYPIDFFLSYSERIFEDARLQLLEEMKK